MSAAIDKPHIFQDTLLRRILKILFPIKCCSCNELSDSYLCTSCTQRLTLIKPECYITRESSKDWIKRPNSNGELEKVYYFYLYDDLIHKLMLDIKYSFHKDKISKVSSLIFESKEFQKIEFGEIDLITFVPISKKRMSWRGFNQAQEITKHLSQYLNISYCQLLLKVKNTKAQIDLSRKNRLKNLESSFSLKENLPIKLSNQNILLIDDICTTGATLEECAKTIKSKYPKVKVFGLCLARGRKELKVKS